MPAWRDIEIQLAANDRRRYWPIIPVVVATVLSIPGLWIHAWVSLGVLVAGIVVAVLLRRTIAVRCPACKRMVRMYGSGTDYVKLLSLKQCPYCNVKYDLAA